MLRRLAVFLFWRCLAPDWFPDSHSTYVVRAIHNEFEAPVLLVSGTDFREHT